MLRRNMTDLFIERLKPLLKEIVDDWELQIEIRDEAVTIYHRGAALLRDIRIDGDQISGKVHFKYVPLKRPEQSKYLKVVDSVEGFDFFSSPEPLPLLDFKTNIVQEYKRTIKSVSLKPEAEIVNAIASRSENRIIDQELKFQETGNPETDKIDLCHFDTRHNCLTLVEVKGIHDSRLRSRDGQIPEVIEQIRRYRTRLEVNSEYIAEACLSSITLKRRLGFAGRLCGVPEAGPLSLMKKPILVVGGCSREEVRAILDGTGEWQLLRDNLKDESAGIILCGKNGCRLDLEDGPQSRRFDSSTF